MDGFPWNPISNFGNVVIRETERCKKLVIIIIYPSNCKKQFHPSTFLQDFSENHVVPFMPVPSEGSHALLFQCNGGKDTHLARVWLHSIDFFFDFFH